MSSEGRASSGGGGGFVHRLRRSVAVRLSVLYALMTIVGLGAIFGMLYWLLDGQLAQREHDELKSRLQEYATIVNTQTMAGLYMRLDRERGTLLEKLFFVRAVAPDLNMQFERVAAGWAEKDGENVAVPEGWDKWTAGQVFSWRTRRDRQEDLIVLSAALPNRVLLQVARAADSRAALLQPLRRTFMHMAPAVVILGFFIGWLVARRAVRPLQGVVDTARRIIATGALDARVAEPKRDNDIAELVRLFNTVLDKNTALLRAMRDSLDNVAHDLRTPLTSMRGTAELALASDNEPAMRDALADTVERSDEVLRLLRALMEISEAEAGMMKLRKEPCDLGALARDAAALYSDVAEARAQELRVAAGEGGAALVVSGDPIRLRQVIANLVDNALKYTPDGGLVDVGARGEARGGRDGALISVRDNGPGVPEAEQGRIWERLYRGDQSRSQSGLGLGLSLVRAIVEAHAGTVAVRNAPAPGHGAVFEVWLPRA